MQDHKLSASVLWTCFPHKFLIEERSSSLSAKECSIPCKQLTGVANAISFPVLGPMFIFALQSECVVEVTTLTLRQI